jgi:fermentation-respiration switch protein FrsA (DUF1100 family)
VSRGVTLALILGATSLVLGSILHAFLFHPSPDEAPEIERVGERVSYRASDGVRLEGWLVRARGPRRRTVVSFHGNAATASDCWPFAVWLAARGSDVLLAEYRGYGRSEGRPSARGIERDAEGAVRFLIETQGVSPAQLIVHGQSLGGAAAIAALAGPARDAAGGVVESSFTSLHDMARQVVGLPLTRLVPDAYALDSAARAADVRAPVLQIHGDRDEVIPYALGERLRERLRPRRFVRIAGGAHNLEDAQVTEEIAAFLDEVTP